MFRLIVLLCLLVPAIPAGAHSGGLDRNGCHTNRKTGDYHCHRGPAPATAAARATVQPQRAAPARPPASGRTYANCTEARAAGAAPVRRGDPGYGAHLDRDNDGIGCE